MAGLPNWWVGPDADYWGTAPIDTYVVEVSTFWHMRWEVVTTPTVSFARERHLYFALKYNLTSKSS